MVTMDEYIEQLLAEMPDSAFHDVVKNILDEPIPEVVNIGLFLHRARQKRRKVRPSRRNLTPSLAKNF